MSQPFRLYSLPPELVREIIKVAATPCTDGYTAGPMYANAVALTSVSYTMRLLTMPHLLNTVVLRSHEDVAAFFRSLKMQREFHKAQNRLSFSYPRTIRRFWCSQFHEPVFNSVVHYDYELLFEVFCHAQQIGFHLHGIELLHEILVDHDRRHDGGVPSHFCKDLTIAGIGIMRWNPLNSTATGAHLLKQIAHLTLLRPDDSIIFHPTNTPHLIPESTRMIPFGLLNNLTHFAVCLNILEVDAISVLLVVNTGCGGEDIKRKLQITDPSSARIVKISTPNEHNDDPALIMITYGVWESAFCSQSFWGSPSLDR